MNNIGTSELVVILIIALLVFGPKKLPEIARSIGRGIFKLKQEFNNLKDTIEEESEGSAGSLDPASSEPEAHQPPADKDSKSKGDKKS